ncbi:MAG TPA: cellulose synthase operon protein YhjQ/BcsQ [Bryobacteraceae bacterium]|jgi:pilus assembly protein CpaE|nr:cellulose synthase operon protein YhjQ/BcsQ [Bryobacteraceae bacterium]
MEYNPLTPDVSRRPEWAWKIGLVLEAPELLSEINSAMAEAGAAKVFEFTASTPSFEVANAVDRDRPDLLFVELAHTSKPAAEWLVDVRSGEDTPLVIAVHPAAEPAEMISALRAGASEFLSLPIRPAIYEAMERIGTLLESRRTALMESGKIAGVLSAKGGCGATSIACYLGAALALSTPATRVLVADLDYQSPGARSVFRANPRAHAGEAFEAVRRLSSSVWREFVTPISNGVDLLASPAEPISNILAAPPEPWRVESLFRFIVRQYNWILVDLGRHLNPSNWTLLQNIEELFVVTAPDVLALYQTRSVLQTLSSRGFEKERTRIVLNRNLSSPQDFWVESIEQMFEMSVFGVVPNDEATLGKLSRDRFEFPAEAPFGRSLMKMAARLAKPNGSGPLRKAA